MRHAGKEITLYNYTLDPVTGYDVSHRAFLPGVSVFAETKVNVSSDGLASASVYTIRIPTDRDEQYLDPASFADLSDKSGWFTLAKGDKIVIGYSSKENLSRGELEKLFGNDRVCTIVGVTDNRDGREPHFKVVCE